MVLFNYTTKEMTAKIVYYGPGLCGKTTNLQYIHRNLPRNRRGDLVTLPTETDRTLFFDLLPLRLGKVGAFTTRIQLYTVPGQVFYNSTRKMVLRGVDGVVFVADSQVPMRDANQESLENLEENLVEHKMTLRTIPWVLQYNKRDLPNVLPISVLNSELNQTGTPWFEAVATTGVGVISTLKAISKMTLQNLRAKAGYVGIRDRDESPPDDIAIIRDDEDRLEKPEARKVVAPGFAPKEPAKAAPPPAPAPREEIPQPAPVTPPKSIAPVFLGADRETVSAAPTDVSVSKDTGLVIVKKLIVPVKIQRSQALEGIKLDLRIEVECVITDESDVSEPQDQRPSSGFSWSQTT